MLYSALCALLSRSRVAALALRPVRTRFYVAVGEAAAPRLLVYVMR